MRYELDWNPTHQRMEVRAAGKLSIKDVAAVTRKIVKHPEWRDGMAVLADYRRVEGYHIEADGVRDLAALMGPLAKELGSGQLAILLDGKLMYGMARMWSAYASFQFSMDVRVFSDEAEALAWLD